MLRFYISPEERLRAQKQAVELDVGKSKPLGRHPYVWDSHIGAVHRWYDYGSPEEKVGSIHFEAMVEAGDPPTLIVECRIQITYRPLGSPRREKITNAEEHAELIRLFYLELLGNTPQCQEGR